MACAVSVSAYALASPAQAQPYDTQADQDYGPSVGSITVTPPYHRQWNSATRRFEDRVYASRVVDLRDLDLNTATACTRCGCASNRPPARSAMSLNDREGDDGTPIGACYTDAVRNALAGVPEYINFRD